MSDAGWWSRGRRSPQHLLHRADDLVHGEALRPAQVEGLVLRVLAPHRLGHAAGHVLHVDRVDGGRAVADHRDHRQVPAEDHEAAHAAVARAVDPGRAERARTPSRDSRMAASAMSLAAEPRLRPALARARAREVDEAAHAQRSSPPRPRPRCPGRRPRGRCGRAPGLRRGGSGTGSRGPPRRPAVKALPRESGSPAKAWTRSTRPRQGSSRSGVARGDRDLVAPARFEQPATTSRPMKPVPPVTTMRMAVVIRQPAPRLQRAVVLGILREHHAPRALVVEDDPDIVELLAHYLAGRRLRRWMPLADGKAALERIRAERLPAPGPRPPAPGHGRPRALRRGRGATSGPATCRS